jgi:hypothetical protein
MAGENQTPSNPWTEVLADDNRNRVSIRLNCEAIKLGRNSWGAPAAAAPRFIDIRNFVWRAKFVERTNHVLSVRDRDRNRYRLFSHDFSILILNPDPIGIGVSSIVSAHRLFSIPIPIPIPIPILKPTGGVLLKGGIFRRELAGGLLRLFVHSTGLVMDGIPDFLSVPRHG